MQKQNMLHVKQLVIWDMINDGYDISHCRTMLISFHDVIKDVNEKELKKLFKRPFERKHFKTYSKDSMSL